MCTIHKHAYKAGLLKTQTIQEGLCFSAPLNLTIFSIVQLKYTKCHEFVSSQKCKSQINTIDLEKISWTMYYGHFSAYPVKVSHTKDIIMLNVWMYYMCM